MSGKKVLSGEGCLSPDVSAIPAAFVPDIAKRRSGARGLHKKARYFAVVALALALLLSSCAFWYFLSEMKKEREFWKSSAIVISVDGFHPKYLARGLTEAINSIGKEGFSADGMLPVFPATTFPNHFSLATGTLPEYHGIVSNVFYDPILKKQFDYKNGTCSGEKEWWLARPIWNVVHSVGKKSGVCFWPGSEAPVLGDRPDYYKRFNISMGNVERMDQLLEWADLPRDRRPSLFMGYINVVDSAGHLHGTVHPGLDKSIKDADSAIRHLIDELRSRGIYELTNFVVLSDHGMQDIHQEKCIYLDDIVAPDLISRVEYGPVTFVRTANFSADIVKKRLDDHIRSNPACGFKAYLKEEVPESLHYRNSERISEIILVCDSHHTFASKQFSRQGDHGYPDESDMDAIFVARGSKIRKIHDKGSIGKFQNLDVFPFLANILGVPPEAIKNTHNGTDYLLGKLVL